MKKTQFADYLEVMLKWRKFIVRNVFIVTVIAIVISLVLVKKYTATATVLPPNPEQQLMMGFMPGLTSTTMPTRFSSMLTGLSGFATPSDLYAEIMKSSRIMREIIKKHDLKKRFKTKTMYDTFIELGDITSVEVSPEGIISVSVTYKDKYLATDIANSYVEELDKFNNETAMTMGKKYRIFVEQRLVEAQDSLNKSENALKDFQEKNRTVSLDAELQAAIETIAQLKSQIIMFEVQKGAWSSAGQADNPYLYQINRELEALKKQLAKIESGDKTKDLDAFGAGFAVPLIRLPEVTLEFARLYRDVKVQEAIFELLTQQYEQAKIMEVKDTPTIQFLDKAGVPEKRSFPKRAVLVILTFAVAIFANIALVFLLEYVSDVKTKPDKHHSMLKFAADLSDDFRGIKDYLKKALRRKKN
jgi:tyrosine-protein kinase Etk/Wzc